MLNGTPRLFAALALLASLILAPGAASAAGRVGDEKLEAFILAALAVDQVIDRWRPRLARADTPDKAAAIRQEANSEIAATIENTDGITLAEYREIRQAVTFDPTMMQRITSLMRQRQASR